MIASVTQLPGASPSTYDAIADWAEAALPWFPTRATHLGACGRALYRANRLEQALEVLTGADHVNRMLAGDPAYPGVPSDLAVVAMTHHRLGHPDEAAGAFVQLRTAMRLELFAGDLESQLLAAEAGALLGR